MRRKYFGLAIAALATLGPMQAWGGDREIAEQIISRLKTNRDSGALKDFTLDMKVDKGVVLFRGNVSQDAQKELVLRAADGIDGITGIVDEVSVAGVAPVAAPPQVPANMIQKVGATEPVGPELVDTNVEKAHGDFSFGEALATEPAPVAIIKPMAGAEPVNDAQVVSAVVEALTQAKQSGELRGFGVDVKSHNGVLQLSGRASSASQRDAIIRIAESVPGVAGLREAIAIPTASPNLPRLPEPPSLQDVATTELAPVNVDPVRPALRNGVPATVASAPVMAAPHRSQVNAPTAAMPAGMPGQMAGGPVPMAPYSPVGAPRYDSPNLPNYAWPGYAAHPNYAALTYPQQYSPSAWPYIGPFYPYPQVPLGWRKVSLEWDDGWWFLDFTDR